MSATTVEVRPDLKAEMENLATQTRRDQSDLANEALAAYLDREKVNLARIRQGLEQARRGQFASEAEVEAFFAKHAGPAA